MKKHQALALLFLALSWASCAQKYGIICNDADSSALLSAAWQVDSIDGMVLKTAHFAKQELFSSNQYIALLEVTPVPYQRGLAFSYRPKRTATSLQATEDSALAAINGSFFDMDLHSPICYLRINDNNISANIPMKKDTVNRKYYQSGTIVLSDDGSAAIIPTQRQIHWEDSALKAFHNIMTAGPLLIYHDSLLPMRQNKQFVTQRHNRTALGIKEDGTILLVTVDGRAREAAGMSLEELQKTLRWLGCKDAINLDGGGSTTLWVKGRPQGEIINHPSDNGRFDKNGERMVSNCLLITSRIPKYPPTGKQVN